MNISNAWTGLSDEDPVDKLVSMFKIVFEVNLLKGFMFIQVIVRM